MGRLVINHAMTVNGAFETPSPDEWLVLGRRQPQRVARAVPGGSRDVLGRKTYEGLAGVNPHALPLRGAAGGSACGRDR
jgi:hypothetical protein